MSEQQFTDFFDPEIQKIVSEDGCSIYRMKNVTGEGVITRYEILPGIELFYNDFHMSDGQNQNKLPHSDVLEINHCREGRFECEFANGDYQYVGAGDLAINRLTNETTSTYFPLSHYHGISITIDLPTADQTMKRIESVIGGLNIDVFSIADKFCKNDTCIVLRTQSEIEHIFSELYRVEPRMIAWVWDLLHFDLGVSLANGHDVWTDIATAFPKTLGIVALASIFQVVFIVIVSCIAFLLPWKLPKKAVRLLCILGVSIPSFYLATVYLDYFAVQKSLISVAGNTTLLSYISPAICIGVFGASFYTPLLMDALEHESNEDYAFYARCRGLSEKRLLLCHFFPRAAMGLVPNFLQSIGLALANATVIESIFSIPGFGYLIVNHVLDRDTPMIHAEVFFLALAIALCNIAADLVQWAIGRKKGVA